MRPRMSSSSVQASHPSISVSTLVMAFIAGALAVPVFHQILLLLLYLGGIVGPLLAAFVILQIPEPTARRFQDPAVTRDMLLNETFNGLNNDDTLDFGDLAEK